MMNGLLDRNRQMDGGREECWMDGQIREQMDGGREGGMLDRQIDDRKTEKYFMDGWLNGQTDGWWMIKQMKGQMYRQTNGRIV